MDVSSVLRGETYVFVNFFDAFSQISTIYHVYLGIAHQ